MNHTSRLLSLPLFLLVVLVLLLLARTGSASYNDCSGSTELWLHDMTDTTNDDTMIGNACKNITIGPNFNGHRITFLGDMSDATIRIFDTTLNFVSTTPNAMIDFTGRVTGTTTIEIRNVKMLGIWLTGTTGKFSLVRFGGAVTITTPASNINNKLIISGIDAPGILVERTGQANDDTAVRFYGVIFATSVNGIGAIRFLNSRIVLTTFCMQTTQGACSFVALNFIGRVLNSNLIEMNGVEAYIERGQNIELGFVIRMLSAASGLEMQTSAPFASVILRNNRLEFSVSIPENAGIIQSNFFFMPSGLGTHLDSFIVDNITSVNRGLYGLIDTARKAFAYRHNIVCFQANPTINSLLLSNVSLVLRSIDNNRDEFRDELQAILFDFSGRSIEELQTLTISDVTLSAPVGFKVGIGATKDMTVSMFVVSELRFLTSSSAQRRLTVQRARFVGRDIFNDATATYMKWFEVPSSGSISNVDTVLFEDVAINFGSQTSVFPAPSKPLEIRAISIEAIAGQAGGTGAVVTLRRCGVDFQAITATNAGVSAQIHVVRINSMSNLRRFEMIDSQLVYATISLGAPSSLISGMFTSSGHITGVAGGWSVMLFNNVYYAQHYSPSQQLIVGAPTFHGINFDGAIDGFGNITIKDVKINMDYLFAQYLGHALLSVLRCGNSVTSASIFISGISFINKWFMPQASAGGQVNLTMVRFNGPVTVVDSLHITDGLLQLELVQNEGTSQPSFISFVHFASSLTGPQNDNNGLRPSGNLLMSRLRMPINSVTAQGDVTISLARFSGTVSGIKTVELHTGNGMAFPGAGIDAGTNGAQLLISALYFDTSSRIDRWNCILSVVDFKLSAAGTVTATNGIDISTMYLRNGFNDFSGVEIVEVREVTMTLPTVQVTGPSATLPARILGSVAVLDGTTASNRPTPIVGATNMRWTASNITVTVDRLHTNRATGSDAQLFGAYFQAGAIRWYTFEFSYITLIITTEVLPGGAVIIAGFTDSGNARLTPSAGGSFIWRNISVTIASISVSLSTSTRHRIAAVSLLSDVQDSGPRTVVAENLAVLFNGGIYEYSGQLGIFSWEAPLQLDTSQGASSFSVRHLSFRTTVPGVVIQGSTYDGIKFRAVHTAELVDGPDTILVEDVFVRFSYRPRSSTSCDITGFYISSSSNPSSGSSGRNAASSITLRKLDMEVGMDWQSSVANSNSFSGLEVSTGITKASIVFEDSSAFFVCERIATSCSAYGLFMADTVSGQGATGGATNVAPVSVRVSSVTYRAVLYGEAPQLTMLRLSGANNVIDSIRVEGCFLFAEQVAARVTGPFSGGAQFFGFLHLDGGSTSRINYIDVASPAFSTALAREFVLDGNLMDLKLLSFDAALSSSSTIVIGGALLEGSIVGVKSFTVSANTFFVREVVQLSPELFPTSTLSSQSVVDIVVFRSNGNAFSGCTDGCSGNSNSANNALLLTFTDNSIVLGNVTPGTQNVNVATCRLLSLASVSGVQMTNNGIEGLSARSETPRPELDVLNAERVQVSHFSLNRAAGAITLPSLLLADNFIELVSIVVQHYGEVGLARVWRQLEGVKVISCENGVVSVSKSATMNFGAAGGPTEPDPNFGYRFALIFLEDFVNGHASRIYVNNSGVAISSLEFVGSGRSAATSGDFASYFALLIRMPRMGNVVTGGRQFTVTYSRISVAAMADVADTGGDPPMMRISAVVIALNIGDVAANSKLLISNVEVGHSAGVLQYQLQFLYNAILLRVATGLLFISSFVDPGSSITVSECLVKQGYGVTPLYIFPTLDAHLLPVTAVSDAPGENSLLYFDVFVVKINGNVSVSNILLDLVGIGLDGGGHIRFDGSKQQPSAADTRFWITQVMTLLHFGARISRSQVTVRNGCTLYDQSEFVHDPNNNNQEFRRWRLEPQAPPASSWAQTSNFIKSDIIAVNAAWLASGFLPIVETVFNITDVQVDPLPRIMTDSSGAATTYASTSAMISPKLLARQVTVTAGLFIRAPFFGLGHSRYGTRIELSNIDIGARHSAASSNVALALEDEACSIDITILRIVPSPQSSLLAFDTTEIQPPFPNFPASLLPSPSTWDTYQRSAQRYQVGTTIVLRNCSLVVGRKLGCAADGSTPLTAPSLKASLVQLSSLMQPVVPIEFSGANRVTVSHICTRADSPWIITAVHFVSLSPALISVALASTSVKPPLFSNRKSLLLPPIVVRDFKLNATGNNNRIQRPGTVSLVRVDTGAFFDWSKLIVGNNTIGVQSGSAALVDVQISDQAGGGGIPVPFRAGSVLDLAGNVLDAPSSSSGAIFKLIGIADAPTTTAAARATNLQRAIGGTATTWVVGCNEWLRAYSRDSDVIASGADMRLVCSMTRTQIGTRTQNQTLSESLTLVPTSTRTHKATNSQLDSATQTQPTATVSFSADISSSRTPTESRSRPQTHSDSRSRLPECALFAAVFAQAEPSDARMLSVVQTRQAIVVLELAQRDPSDFSSKLSSSSPLYAPSSWTGFSNPAEPHRFRIQQERWRGSEALTELQFGGGNGNSNNNNNAVEPNGNTTVFTAQRIAFNRVRLIVAVQGADASRDLAFSVLVSADALGCRMRNRTAYAEDLRKYYNEAKRKKEQQSSGSSNNKNNDAAAAANAIEIKLLTSSNGKDNEINSNAVLFQRNAAFASQGLMEFATGASTAAAALAALTGSPASALMLQRSRNIMSAFGCVKPEVDPETGTTVPVQDEPYEFLSSPTQLALGGPSTPKRYSRGTVLGNLLLVLGFSSLCLFIALVSMIFNASDSDTRRERKRDGERWLGFFPLRSLAAGYFPGVIFSCVLPLTDGFIDAGFRLLSRTIAPPDTLDWILGLAAFACVIGTFAYFGSFLFPPRKFFSVVRTKNAVLEPPRRVDGFGAKIGWAILWFFSNSVEWIEKRFVDEKYEEEEQQQQRQRRQLAISHFSDEDDHDDGDNNDRSTRMSPQLLSRIPRRRRRHIYFVERFGSVFDARRAAFFWADFFEGILSFVMVMAVTANRAADSANCEVVSVFVSCAIALALALSVQFAFAVVFENVFNLAGNALLVTTALLSCAVAYRTSVVVAKNKNLDEDDVISRNMTTIAEFCSLLLLFVTMLSGGLRFGFTVYEWLMENAPTFMARVCLRGFRAPLPRTKKQTKRSSKPNADGHGHENENRNENENENEEMRVRTMHRDFLADPIL